MRQLAGRRVQLRRWLDCNVREQLRHHRQVARDKGVHRLHERFLLAKLYAVAQVLHDLGDEGEGAPLLLRRRGGDKAKTFGRKDGRAREAQEEEAADRLRRGGWKLLADQQANHPHQFSHGGRALGHRRNKRIEHPLRRRLQLLHVLVHALVRGHLGRVDLVAGRRPDHLVDDGTHRFRQVRRCQQLEVVPHRLGRHRVGAEERRLLLRPLDLAVEQLAQKAMGLPVALKHRHERRRHLVRLVHGAQRRDENCVLGHERAHQGVIVVISNLVVCLCKLRRNVGGTHLDGARHRLLLLRHQLVLLHHLLAVRQVREQRKLTLTHRIVATNHVPIKHLYPQR
mmetsp:Transcript_9562/g.30293  ORF Transcript_9562/g.30293 Transcript_9562/m.30293 type:complete len:340 (+) Transcript_9562:1232-2251(+)